MRGRGVKVKLDHVNIWYFDNHLSQIILHGKPEILQGNTVAYIRRKRHKRAHTHTHSHSNTLTWKLYCIQLRFSDTSVKQLTVLHSNVDRCFCAQNVLLWETFCWQLIKMILCAHSVQTRCQQLKMWIMFRNIALVDCRPWNQLFD